MFCHGKQTVCVPWQNITNTTWHECGKQNFTRYSWSYMLTNCSHFSGQGSYYGYTHAWTNVTLQWSHNLNLWRLWVSLRMALTWSELNYCAWFNDTACEQPAHCLSWSAVAFSRSIGLELDSEILTFTRTWNVCIRSFREFKFSVYGHTQTYTRVLQCSPASVGLAQALPNN